MSTTKKISGDYTIETVTAGSNVTITTDHIVLTGDVSVGRFLQLPVYANNAARDAAITSPAAGMLIFNTTGTKFQGYTGAAWVDLN
jgi:hypothetical protein